MAEFRQALPEGYVLAGDYRITGVLGQGGFGLTYRADELRLGRAVAIKEYFPSDLALRERGSTVVARSARDEGVLAWGRAKFLDEARTLARFRHPAIVRVARLFEANNTAYMVLDFEAGPNLAQWRETLGRAPTQAEVDRVADRLLEAVGAVHEAGILHRDIKPANVIMRDGSEPVLIDFGAARQALSAQSRTVHAIVTPGYSPKEQYAVDLDRQGAWSDIYALGATLYFLVTGRAPPDALSRDLGEAMRTAATAPGDYRASFLEAIDRAMSVRPEDRPQSTTEWRQMLLGGASAAGGATAAPASRTGEAAPRTLAGGAQAQARAPAAGRPVLAFDDVPSARPASPARAAGGRGLVATTVLAGILALGGLGWWILIAAPERDRTAWERAQAADTREAYERYIAEQPSGRHVAEAQQRRDARAQAARAGGVSLSAATETRPPVAVPPARETAPAPTPTPTPTPAPTAPPATPQQTQPATPPPAAPQQTQAPPPAPTTAAPQQTQVAPQPLPAPASTPPPPPSPPQQQAAATANPEAQPPAAPAGTASAPAVPAPLPAGFQLRTSLPQAMSEQDTARVAQAARAARWRVSISVFAGERIVGFTDQIGDFNAELARLSGGKLEISLLDGEQAIRRSELYPRLRSERDLIAWSAPLLESGRHIEFTVLGGAVPLGLEPADLVRWMRADGVRLLEQSYAASGQPVRAIPCGIAGGVGAWFRREIRSPADFRGLRVRAGILLTRALRKLEAVPVSLSSNRELAAAYQQNRIDANFNVTSLTGIFLGEQRLANVYHFPSVHSPAYLFDLLVGPETWAAMDDAQRRLIDEACRRNLDRWAQFFPVSQNEVLNRIRTQRITVRPFTAPVREAIQKAVDEVLAEESQRNPRFREVLESYNRFRR